MLTENGFVRWERVKVRALNTRDAKRYYYACNMLEVEPEAKDLFEQGELEMILLSKKLTEVPKSPDQSYSPSSYRSTEY